MNSTDRISSLLTAVLENSIAADQQNLDSFLESQNTSDLLLNWIKFGDMPKSIKSKSDLLRLLSTEIARLDDILNQQFNAILHHPELQKLEASWRGLRLLVDQLDERSLNKIKIRLLDVSWIEINKDVARFEFDQSVLFDKIYTQEFGSAGGEPFGLLIGDYYLNIQGKNSSRDLDTLYPLAEIAAASFCPFIASTTPESFQVDHFSEIAAYNDLSKLFTQPEYYRWNNFRNKTESQFTGLVLPRVLLRNSYHYYTAFKNQFVFTEDTIHSNEDNYLWGNACFAFALVVIKSFQEHGWFGDIRGIAQDNNNGGLVKELPHITHNTDAFAKKYSSEITIDEYEESTLAENGFIPVSQYHDIAIFYSNMSTHKSTEHYSNAQTKANQKISSMLQYILCACRIGHYIKVIARNKIGSYTSTADLERTLLTWLKRYTASNEVDSSLRLKYPLQGAQVKITETQGKPGVYNCIIHLQPRYQLEKINTALTLITELAEIST